MTTSDTPTVPGAIVTLREFTDDDMELVRAGSLDPLVPLITSLPASGDDPALRQYIRRQRDRAATGEGFQFVIVDNESAAGVGQIGLTFRDVHRERASIGYWIADSSRRRGLAAAALSEVVRWALVTQGLLRLELYVEPWNEGSWRTAESAGFVREGLMRRWERVGDERRDMYMYAMVSAPERSEGALR